MWLALLALLALNGCDWLRSATTRAVNPTRGYVLISIDTLRADHLGLYGYQRPTSPFLDDLATRAVVFDHAIVQLPGTLPSHMSIFTGLYPPEHGVYPPDGILPSHIPTIPEVLQRSGFRTAGFTEGGFTAGHFGFARGFDKFSDEVQHQANDVETTFGLGARFLESLQPADRFFLFLHTYSVHDPYDPPERYREMLAPDGPPPGAFEPTGTNFVQFNQGELPMTREAMEYYKTLYDAEIRYTDDVLAGFFAALARLGLDSQTTVIITSDHGEEFLDHGKMVHEQVYHELLHVPLLIVHPYAAPARIDALVQSIDIAPTIYALARVRPPPVLSGVSLVPYLEGRRAPLRQQAYAEAFVTTDHAMYLAQGDELHHYIAGDAPTVGGVASVGKLLRFDWQEGQQISVRSFREPRHVTLSVNGQPLTDLSLTPLEWTALPLADLPAQQRGQISLEADGCVAPAALGESDDTRCLAMQLQGGLLMRRELYDVRNDAAEQHNLARSNAALTDECTQKLAAHQPVPVPRKREELDPALRERLRSLGYLE